MKKETERYMVHGVEIAVLRKLKDFELICNYPSFIYATT
jgi:hypothetical protein